MASTGSVRYRIRPRAVWVIALASPPAFASRGAAGGSDPTWLGLAVLLPAILVAAITWLAWRRERAARVAAEQALERERARRRMSVSRRVRHFETMGREAERSLTELGAAIDLVDGQRLEPSMRLYVAALRRAASALGGQLSHAIDYEAIEQGRVQPRPQRTDVVALLREVAAQSSAMAADRRIAYALFVPQHPIPTMLVDPIRLRQMVDALVGDALDASGCSEVRVEMRFRRDEAGGDEGQLVVTVRDDAPPPSEAGLARLQASLDDVPVEPSGSDGGSGQAGAVGASLWRAGRLASALRGSLRLVHALPEGLDGPGLCRELALPVRFDAPGLTRGAVLEDLNAGFGRPAMPAGGATRGRLLLVEDDRVVQFTLEHTLGRLGWDVVCADDAEEGLALWLAAPTAIVLTDLGLPGRDGVSLIRAIREAERRRGELRTRIVVLTGEAAHGDRAREAGADEVLEKPAGSDALARVLGGAVSAGVPAAQPARH
ncbi:MAG: hypothetical protein RJA99_4206 [Pseudomonadota bacterium]|jgi:two-component system sensor histidine kinase EvgS